MSGIDSSASTTSRSDGSGSSGDFGALPTIEGYDILSRIHGGAQGVVYKAVQKSTSRTVAVKVLLHEVAGHAATDRQKHRFEREINLAAGLRHPNIVTIYDSGLTSGRYFFAMEYIHGQSLDEHLGNATLTIPEKLRLFATICSAIHYAHQKGVIHRDLKPGNILVDAAGQPHIVDFGLAKPAGLIAMQGEAPFTQTSQFMGTIAYASPEQTKGDPALVDTRSDVYSLGVILFEMLTAPGVYPYPMSPLLMTMFQTICHTPPRVPSSINKDIDDDLDTIALRALAKETERRYQTVADLQRDIERRLAGEPIGARRDSLPYLIRLKTRQVLRRHRLLTNLCIVFLSALMVLMGAKPFFRWWPQPIEYFEYAATRFLTPPMNDRFAMEEIRIISIDDQTEAAIELIAKKEGFTDVTRDTWRSVRRLHGRLMEKLARQGVKAVAWDIAFPENSPYNDDFNQGIVALHAAGADTAIGMHTWDIDEQKSGMAPDILEHNVKLGGATMVQSDLAPWRADLVVERDGRMCLPSFSLAAFAAMRYPKQPLSVFLERADETIHLRFSSDRSALGQSGTTIKLSEIRECDSPTEEDRDMGINAGDLIGLYAFAVPPNAVLDAATISYHDVFAADDSQLQDWFKDKLVLIGDMRSSSQDRHQSNDGRVLAGPHLNAALIDSLLRDALFVRYPRDSVWLMVLLASAMLGAIAAWGPRARSSSRWIILSLGGVVIVVFSALALQFAGYLINPYGPAIAMVVCFAALLTIRPHLDVDGNAPH